jgi:hypothetical protein
MTVIRIVAPSNEWGYMLPDGSISRLKETAAASYIEFVVRVPFRCSMFVASS